MFKSNLLLLLLRFPSEPLGQVNRKKETVNNLRVELAEGEDEDEDVLRLVDIWNRDRSSDRWNTKIVLRSVEPIDIVDRRHIAIRLVQQEVEEFVRLWTNVSTLADRVERDIARQEKQRTTKEHLNGK